MGKPRAVGVLGGIYDLRLCHQLNPCTLIQLQDVGVVVVFLLVIGFQQRCAEVILKEFSCTRQILYKNTYIADSHGCIPLI